MENENEEVIISFKKYSFINSSFLTNTVEVFNQSLTN
jgi:hypothetical protein